MSENIGKLQEQIDAAWTTYETAYDARDADDAYGMWCELVGMLAAQKGGRTESSHGQYRE